MEDANMIYSIVDAREVAELWCRGDVVDKKLPAYDDEDLPPYTPCAKSIPYTPSRSYDSANDFLIPIRGKELDDCEMDYHVLRRFTDTLNVQPGTTFTQLKCAFLRLAAVQPFFGTCSGLLERDRAFSVALVVRVERTVPGCLCAKVKRKDVTAANWSQVFEEIRSGWWESLKITYWVMRR
jgi:hypothetical protein